MINPIPGARVPREPTQRGAYGFPRTATHTHQGIDLAAPEGTPVRAVADGYVSRVVDTPGTRGFRGYGRAIVLRHTINGDRRWTLYAHLSAIDPRTIERERVTAGQVIGYVGRTCDTREDRDHKCKGAHLHFEVSPRAYPQPSESPRINPAFFLPKRTTP